MLSTLFTVFLAVLVLPSTSDYGVAGYDKGKIIIYTDDAKKTFSVGPAQRCYSMSCICCLQTFITIEDVQDVAKVVFYSKENCQGSADLTFTANYLGTAKGKTYNVGSFMVLESGMYPTRGIVNLCPSNDESAKWNTTGMNLAFTTSFSPPSASTSASGDDDGETIVFPA